MVGTGWGLRFARRLWARMELRRRRFDCLVYLAPSLRTPRQLRRDRWFFSAAGIPRICGFSQFPQFPAKGPGGALPAVPSEADLLLARVAADGVATPPRGEGCFDLNLGSSEDQAVASWLGEQPGDGNRPWIGVGPGSKMPAKRWPVERFAEVASALIASHRVWPVVFGGPEDQDVGAKLIEGWGCGYNAAGHLAVRPAAAALKKCHLYLGNDTGTMHLAAAGGVACAAIFSSRDHPGRWYPAGPGHSVFRTGIDCEGCRLTDCAVRGMECLDRISAREVLAGCRAALETGSHRRTPNHAGPDIQ